MSEIRTEPGRAQSRGVASEVPSKLYFRIGEAAELVGVKPYVLRYWETEFPAIRPQKSRSGQRVYRREDVLLVRQIQRLLYEERLTIEGARKRLRELKKSGSPLPPTAPASSVSRQETVSREAARIAQELFALARRPISEIFAFAPSQVEPQGSA